MRDSPENLVREPWEAAGVEALCRLLTQRKLKELVGDLEGSIRVHRKELTGKDRPSSKEQLAAALVIQHGPDLLAQPAVRKLVAKAAKIPYLGRWHPGKDGPYAFVADAGFPDEYAGQPADRTPEDELDLEPPPQLSGLADFQKELRDAALKVLRAKDRAIVSLPTGAGKTRVAVEVLRRYLGGRKRPGVVVWLAQSEELCEQAVECFTQVWRGDKGAPPMRLVRLWGSFSKGKGHRLPPAAYRQRPTVVVSTPQRYRNELEARDPHPVAGELARFTRVLVVDEAHRGAAPTYQGILADLEGVAPGFAVLGLTATPFAKEYDEEAPLAGTRELQQVFRQLLTPDVTLGRQVRERLQERGILATPQVVTVETGVRLPTPRRPRGRADSWEFDADEQLAAAADRPARRRRLLAAIRPIAEDPANSVLYFGPRVLDAASMAYLLRSEGIPAAFLSGETKRATRRKLIEDFRAGAVRVLCNCEVLTTGFDAPRVTHVVVARPTVSGVLYQQMVGRGLRGPLFGGTERCTIVDCEDGFAGSRRGLRLGLDDFRDVWGVKPRAWKPGLTF
jgi:superfamily II DNA or RNA helicase